MMSDDKMGAVTGVVLAGFAAYGLGWYMGVIEGNFALLLFLATVVTGVYWVAEKRIFLPRRRAAAENLAAEQARRSAELEKIGVKADSVDVAAAQQKLLEQPWWLDWTAGLFPVIVVVFLLRSFLFEPFNSRSRRVR